MAVGGAPDACATQKKWSNGQATIQGRSDHSGAGSIQRWCSLLKKKKSTAEAATHHHHRTTDNQKPCQGSDFTVNTSHLVSNISAQSDHLRLHCVRFVFQRFQSLLLVLTMYSTMSRRCTYETSKPEETIARRLADTVAVSAPDSGVFSLHEDTCYSPGKDGHTCHTPVRLSFPRILGHHKGCRRGGQRRDTVSRIPLAFNGFRRVDGFLGRSRSKVGRTTRIREARSCPLFLSLKSRFRRYILPENNQKNLCHPDVPSVSVMFRSHGHVPQS